MQWTCLTVGLAACSALVACSSAPSTGSLRNTSEPGASQELTFRRFSTGMVRTSSSLTTYTLRRSGTQATLEEIDAVLNHGNQLAPDTYGKGWVESAPKLYAGPVVERGGGAFDLELTAGGEELALVCKPAKVEAAAANATRTRSSKDMECGDRGAWRPGNLVAVDVIACRARPEGDEPPPPTDPDELSWHREEIKKSTLMFAAPPGLEYLYVNDDCRIQGGDLRLVAPNKAIAEVRADD
jgi:hypothetical protein